MNEAVERMLAPYGATSVGDTEKALREIIQEIVLVGLNEAGFFSKAAFYGGTALRILYGLDRFSEDLDFTMLEADEGFAWAPYEKTVEETLAAYGFSVTMSEKKKSQKSAVKSAFLKANTFQELIRVGVGESSLHGIHPDTLIRIKVEVDTTPCIAYGTEERYLREPIPTSIRSVTEEYLFVGKMHAALFRQWRNRVKGRDWYDMVWFIRRRTPLNLALFSEMMGRQSVLTPEQFRDLAKEKISSLDIPSALQDIRVFANNLDEVRDWSQQFFEFWIDQLTFA